jgi:hypothetical protein
LGKISGRPAQPAIANPKPASENIRKRRPMHDWKVMYRLSDFPIVNLEKIKSMLARVY